MKLLLCTVFDSKVQAFLPPMTFRSIGEASRAFETACKDESSSFAKYPADFSFLEIGTFDELTGNIQVHDQHKILHNAAEFKNL